MGGGSRASSGGSGSSSMRRSAGGWAKRCSQSAGAAWPSQPAATSPCAKLRPPNRNRLFIREVKQTAAGLAKTVSPWNSLKVSCCRGAALPPPGPASRSSSSGRPLASAAGALVSNHDCASCVGQGASSEDSARVEAQDGALPGLRNGNRPRHNAVVTLRLARGLRVKPEFSR